MKSIKIISGLVLVFVLLASTQTSICLAEDKEDVVPAYTPPQTQDLTPVKLPPIEEKILNDGLKVVVVEHHELPVVSLRLMCKAGSQYDPAGKAGATSFMADLLTKGTKNRTASEIADEIDFIGGNLGAGSGWSGTYVTCTVLKKHLAKGLDIMQDVVLNPTFADDEIERNRQSTLSSIVNSKDQPSSVASKAYSEWLFGDHPYALPTEGTEETIAGLTREDIVGMYDLIFAPNNSVLFVVGDIKPKEGFKLAKEAFSSWEKGAAPVLSLPQTDAPEGYKIRLINKSDATQAQIRMGHLGISRDNEDYFPVTIMNYILGGGGFSSRLVKIIRSEMGLTYGVSSSFSARLDQGPFTISTFTKNESTLDAINAMLDVVKTYQEEGPTDQELQEAKSYLTGSYPLNFETPGDIASQLQSIEIYGLGSDYIEKYRSRIDAVTQKDVMRVAQEYLHPEDMLIVVLSNAEEVKADLEQIGPVEVVEID
ncbi:insulinase family protein [bacterium]|nr:insulinase family protein [bacterium]MBU1881432.1 insulinase family protein [bacterium]